MSMEPAAWQFVQLPAGLEVRDSELLFKRIDKKVIDAELEKLEK